MNVLNMDLGENSYPIIIGRGLLERAAEFFNLDRKVFIVTDDGVPNKYAEIIKVLCKCATVKTVAQGEGSKSFKTLEDLLFAMSEFGMSRGDCVVAVGGGVVGDLSGFAASIYMRGVDFYNVPTTLLSQVDSSIGGKTAVNLGCVKNTVGSFKQPKAVLVDVDTLVTLPKRHWSNGICEAVKMAATSNKKLFEKFEALSEEELYADIEDIVTEALKIKKAVVEADECEKGVRKILNFGHTFGHAIESAQGLSGLYHGECVSLGILALTSGNVRERLEAVLKKLSLPTKYTGDKKEALTYISHDKKCTQNGVSVILCPEIGKYEIKNMSLEDFSNLVLNQA